MSFQKYQTLFSEKNIGNVTLKNRIMSSAHQTTLVKKHLPTEDFIAYHTERAKGGVGLIVMEAHGVHSTGLNTPFAIDASNPKIVDIHRKTAENVHKYGAKLFAQLIHHGREAYVSDDSEDVVAPSAVPTERFHIIPRELEDDEIEDIIEGFIKSAIHLQEAGLDGIEFAGSHTYLFEQFWSPVVNKRKDKWGGSFENRMRFSREVMKRVREAVGDNFVIGMRMSLDALDEVGTSGKDSLDVIKHLQELKILDYWSMVIGSSATYKGSSFIVPPPDYTADDLFKDIPEMNKIIGDTPVIITSRIYTPEIAESMLNNKHVDMVGMTRALIADPHLPNKLIQDKAKQIIPCIACNQGCIGRYQEHLPIRCTVNPITGRERFFADYLHKDDNTQKIAVIGGGPSGMITALTHARRGNKVILYETDKELGGQLRWMENTPNNNQVKTWRTFLNSELNRLEVKVELETNVTLETLKEVNPDLVVVASGAKPLIPEFFSETDIPVYSSWDVLKQDAIAEDNILVADWKGTWEGVGTAEVMAKQGKRVEIISQSYAIAESIQQYKRNQFLENLDTLGVKQTPNFKVTRAGQDSIIIEHLFSGRQESRKPDAIVLALGEDASDSLLEYRNLKKHFDQVIRVGDAKQPRSLDEAVWEGFKAASIIS